MAEENKLPFPTEVIDLPSGGKIYGKDSPLYDGKVEIKYMTAREEDILTSENLIKKGVVIDKLLDALIVTPGVTTNNLFLGDKNALMVAARILAYGPEYVVEVATPSGKREETFNLTDCPFKDLPEDVDYTKNEFKLTLPLSKAEITWKLLTGADEKAIDAEMAALKKLKREVEPTLTTRLKYVVTSVNGESDKATISNFVDNLLSRDSIILRDEIGRITPDINMKQEIVDDEGETVEVVIPMTVGFFWPNAKT